MTVARHSSHNGKAWRPRLEDLVRRGPGANGQAAALAGSSLSRGQRATLGLLAVLFVAAALAILDYGPPPLAIHQGEKVQANFLARVNFGYEDTTAYNEARKQAVESTPNVYLQEPGWAEQLRADVDKLVEAKTKAKDLEEFRKAVADLKLVADPKQVEPLWNALEGLTSLPDEIVAPIGGELARLQERGVLKNDRWQAESDRRIERRAADRKDLASRDVVKAITCFSEEGAAREIEKAIARDFKRRPKVLPEALKSLVLGRPQQPSLVYDKAQSEAAQKKAEADVDSSVATRKHSKGDLLLRAGDVIGDQQIQMLRAENQAYWAAAGPGERLLRTAGLFLVVTVLFGLAIAWMCRAEPETLRRTRQLAVLGLLGVAVLVGAKLVAGRDWPAQAAPAVFFAMAGAMVFSARSAAAPAVLLSALCAVALGGSFFGAAALTAGALTGALAGARPRHHLDVLKAALVAGLVAAAAAAAGQMLTGLAEAGQILRQAGWGLGAALAQGLVLAGALPLLEAAFGATTSVSLRVLCDPNQSPVLRTLFLNAPGSYQHSAVVGMLSESAAAAVGANPLLARAGGYYHDVGKIARPEYFVENAPPGENRHDRLNPTMSAMVVIAHVRDGAELARAFRLPRSLLEIIEQHHGTTLAEFFYRRALDRGEQAAESVYRYAGPCPQSKEAAIVLLADAVEAASRTLEDPSVARLESMVREIARHRLLEGQFDQCGLTLQELAVIEGTFIRILISMFHARVAYPDGQPVKPDEGKNGAARP